MDDIKHFYKEVIRDFIESLNKRYQTREGLESQRIDDLQRRLQEKIKHPQELFTHVINQLSQIDMQKHDPQPTDHENIIQDVVKSEQHLSDDSDSDDLKKFEVQVKQQPNDSDDDHFQAKFQGNKEEKIEQNADDSAQENLNRAKNAKLKNNICMHIVGTYSTKNKKHIARDQKTRIELDNVFIKFNTYGDHHNQVCFSKLSCDFVRTYMDDIDL